MTEWLGMATNIEIDPDAPMHQFIELLVKNTPIGRGAQVECQIPVIENGHRSLLCFDVKRESVQ